MLGVSRDLLSDERGSSPAEFALVGTLLALLTVAALQLGLALHVRNTVLDAAAEGARYGALADRGPSDAAARTAELITTAVGEGYAHDITVGEGEWRGHPVLTVTVRATLPLVGLLGAEQALEVSGHAAVETLG